MPHTNIHPLFRHLFDYAGLFPPSTLDMTTAVANYATYRQIAHSPMLARFVLPLAALERFESAAQHLLPAPTDDLESNDHRRWQLSAIIDHERPLHDQIEAVFDFNHRHEAEPDAGLAEIDALELRATTPEDVDAAMANIPEQLDPFFELDHAQDIRGFLAALAGTGGSAKIRCGGVTPDKIPAAPDIARFIHACAQAEVPFKFTAGLHHPIRKDQPLTYGDNPPRAVMHGFVNVLTAAALALTRRADTDTLEHCINETNPEAFEFNDASVTWNNHTLSADDINRTRDAFAISIGSCSFTEPIEDLTHLNVLSPSPATKR